MTHQVFLHCHVLDLQGQSQQLNILGNPEKFLKFSARINAPIKIEKFLSGIFFKFRLLPFEVLLILRTDYRIVFPGK